MKSQSLISLASSFLIGLTATGLATSVFPKTSLASDSQIESFLDQPLDQIDSEPSTSGQTFEFFEQQDESNTLDLYVVHPKGRPAIAPTTSPSHPVFGDSAFADATFADSDTLVTTPLFSLDQPLVVENNTIPQPEQRTVTVFVPTATTRSIAGATVLEITPERRSITLTPSDGDRVAAWRSQLRNDLIQPIVSTGYRGVPAPPAEEFPTTPGAIQVATADLNRNYLNNLFSTPNLPANSLTDGLMVYPLHHVVPITSPFGWRKHPIYGNARLHAGIDLGASYGTPVLAVLPGKVIAVGNAGGYGLRIVLQHGEQTQTLYAHLSQAFVNVGDIVQAGQAIGKVGTSGNVTGPHLHLEFQQRTANGWEAVDFRDQLNRAASNRTNSVHSVTVPVVPATPLADPAAPILRVAIGKRLKDVRLAASTPAWILDAQQRPIAVLPEREVRVAIRTPKGIKVGTSALPPVFFIQPSNHGAVAVNDKWYRGRLLVASLPDGLVVVNWIDIESYLYSVVGSESYPSWGQEALKAQAIAARTYALKIRNEEPASTWFDLDDTPRYQRYRGIETEFRSTIQAVAATHRQILVDSQHGSLILSQYAATQELVNSVHQGYGLSQWGAASLAQQGFEYHQILRHYYPGTLLTVIGNR